MRLVALGISHETGAPIELLERVSFTPAHLAAGLDKLHKEGGFIEAIILSTCQRTELYGLVPDTSVAELREEAARFLAEFFGFAAADTLPHLQCHQHGGAVEHLFRVVSGLDSIALGESQILGQVREAYGAALGANTAGKILSKLFRMAVRVGKDVRTETAIGRSPVSISSLAVDLANQVLGGVSGKQVLIIGSGEMSELAARLLKDRGVKDLFMINRTHGRAQEMARALGGEAVPWDSLTETLQAVDVVITSTAAPHHVIHVDQVRAVMAQRRTPLVIVDIAMPRDVEPEVGQIERVHLYNLDNLEAVVEKNRQEREGEIPKAVGIIESKVEDFLIWLESLRALPTLTALRAQAEEVRRSELKRAFDRLNSLSERDREVVEQLSHRIITKLLHLPTVNLREKNGSVNDLEEAARRLFGLEEDS